MRTSNHGTPRCRSSFVSQIYSGEKRWDFALPSSFEFVVVSFLSHGDCFVVALGYQEEGGWAEKRCVGFWLLPPVISSISGANWSDIPFFCLTQLECQWKRRTGYHSFPSFTMTSPMRFQPICRSCSILHLQIGSVYVLVAFFSSSCCFFPLISSV
jgi:hypothetical protein